jgi:hypothetical protein
MAEWSRHEAFCGSDATASTLYRDAAQLAAIAELMHAQRAAIGADVVAALRACAKLISERGLGTLYAYELQAHDALHPHILTGLDSQLRAVSRVHDLFGLGWTLS